MNQERPPLSPDLQQLVDENFLIAREAQAVRRLPRALQEKAIELSERERVAAMERIVSGLLNPQAAKVPEKSPPDAEQTKGEILGGIIGLLLFSVGLFTIGRWMWHAVAAFFRTSS